MQEELRRHSDIGDIAGITYFARQVLGPSRVYKESIQKLCDLQNNIRLHFGAAVAFFKYLQIIDEEDGFLCPKENAIELRNSSDFNKAFCVRCLTQILNDGVLDTDAVYYKKEKDVYVVEKCAFSIQTAIFRNILLQYKVLEESNGDLIINPEYESTFAICKRKQRVVKSLAQLKEQLEKQDIQGEKAELFVMEYEKQRLALSLKQHSIKRISIIDVAAGYDILSYENEASTEYDRFIEVKSFSGSPHFYWSQNEIEKAELYEDNYYIYLVDILKINTPNYEPTIVRNPIKTIWKNDSWIMNPISYLVIPTA